MEIVFLDAYTMNPGDIDFSPFLTLGNFASYDRTLPGEIAERAGNAEVIIVNKFPVNETTLRLMPAVRYICVAATGYNNIDLEAVKRRKIWVSNVKDYSTDSVAQHVFASALAWFNRIERYDSLVKSGEWSAKDDFCFYTETIFPLSGQTLGIAGYGSIGKRVASIGKVFGMNIKVYSRSRIVEEEGIQQVNKDEFFQDSDIISLHMPLNDDTRHWINKDSLEQVKPNLLLVNTARGPLVNADDLYRALQNNRIAGAVLDVLDIEPPKEPHPLIFHPNCLVTPHIAWAGLEARKKLLEGIISNINDYKKGLWSNPVYVV